MMFSYRLWESYFQCFQTKIVLRSNDDDHNTFSCLYSSDYAQISLSIYSSTLNGVNFRDETPKQELSIQ